MNFLSRKFTKFVCLIIALLTAVFPVSCKKDDVKTEYFAFPSWEAALYSVEDGSFDVAVVDSIYANYYINTLNHDKLTILKGDDFRFLSEEYSIATKKGSNVTDYLNAAIYHFQYNTASVKHSNQAGVLDVKIDDVAALFGLSDNLLTIEKPQTEIDTPYSPDSAWAKIMQLDHTFTIGITLENNNSKSYSNLPVVFFSHKGGMDGFEILLTRAIGNIYGKTVDGANCRPVNWDERKNAIENGDVDLFIGGFNKETMGKNDFDFTLPYLKNSQVLVVRKTDAESYSDLSSIKGKKITAAQSSKGERVYNEFLLDYINE